MRIAATFQGNPCIHGHDGLRYVGSRLCVPCQRKATRAYRSREGVKHQDRMRNHMARRWEKYPEEKLWRGAKSRAAAKGVDFAIAITDVIIPEECPLLEIPLKCGVGKVSPNSPTLDRISNERGYVPGNVWVISNAANTCKGQLDAGRILQLGVRLRLKENSVVL